MIGNLSEKEYWDAGYRTRNLKPNMFVGFKMRIKDILDNSVLCIFSNIYEYILWENIFNKYLPKAAGLRILEIGSAPGNNLLKFYRKFGYRPYGVEYTVTGSHLNRVLFENNNIPVENIYEEDVFSQKFQERFNKAFDVVFSCGFVEHFTDPQDVINNHLNLLKDGGIVVVTIPNLRGKLNHILCNFFNRDVVKKHNLAIMELNTFKKMFDNKRVKCIYSDYYGIFSFSFFNATSAIKQFVLDICLVIQLFLNFFFRFAGICMKLESKHTSPFLVYIGKKNV